MCTYDFILNIILRQENSELEHPDDVITSQNCTADNPECTEEANKPEKEHCVQTTACAAQVETCAQEENCTTETFNCGQKVNNCSTVETSKPVVPNQQHCSPQGITEKLKENCHYRIAYSEFGHTALSSQLT